MYDPDHFCGYRLYGRISDDTFNETLLDLIHERNHPIKIISE